MSFWNQPPPGVQDADAAAGYAILPQQTAKQLQISEVHSRLDRVLNFLQRDVGYCFVADAKPERGGSVKLQDPTIAVPAPWRNNKKSARYPVAEGPSEAPGDSTPKEDPAPDVVFRSSRGPLDPRRLEAECGEYRIGAEASRYAQYPDDLVLVARFARLLVQACPSFADRAKSQAFLQRVLQGVRLMHLCEFNYSDVVITLAYTTIYFQSTFKAIGHLMTDGEAANVTALLIFLAHSYVLDETCPLRCWQKHIFRKYCTLKMLDAALFRLFNLRGFALRLTAAEESHALHGLLISTISDENWDGTAHLKAAAAAALNWQLNQAAPGMLHAMPAGWARPPVRQAAVQTPTSGSPARGDAGAGPCTTAQGRGGGRRSGGSFGNGSPSQGSDLSQQAQVEAQLISDAKSSNGGRASGSRPTSNSSTVASSDSSEASTAAGAAAGGRASGSRPVSGCSTVASAVVGGAAGGGVPCAV